MNAHLRLLFIFLFFSAAITAWAQPTLTFSPANGATGIAENVVITISSNQDLDRCDNSSITDTNVDALITLRLNSSAGPIVLFDATFDDGATNRIITITPNTPLPSNTVIFVEISCVEGTGNTDIPAPQSVTFTTGDTQAPVPAFTPTAGATNVSVSNDLTITFNEAIRKIDDSPVTVADIEGGLVELRLTNSGGATVAFTALYAGNTITINPTANLSGSTLYYLAVHPVEDGAGNASTLSSVTFTTADIIPPTVTTFNPAGGATGVSETTSIVLSLSEPVRRASDDADLDNTNIDALVTLKFTDALGANISFNATINGTDDQITITPSSVLPSNAIIYVALTGVEDASGNLLSPNPQSITFTTGDTQAPVATFAPAAGATNVSVSNDLTITFNEAIRKIDDSPVTVADIEGGLVELRLTNSGGATVAFTALYAGNTITINPSANLSGSTLYYLAIQPVEDAAGNATALSSVTFTTADIIPPTVTTFNPAGGATGVSETTSIVLSLSEPVRRASDDADLDNANIDALVTLKLTDASGANISFNATINGTDDQITITPSSVLPSNAIIYVALTGVEDASGNLLSPNPQSITFTTGDTQAPVATFNPANGAINVSASGNIIITLNEAIRKINDSPIVPADLLTLVELKLTNDGGTAVGFNASIDGTNQIITIVPTATLLASQVYFVELNPVEDIYDNATVLPNNITFTTEQAPSTPAFTPSATCIGDNVTINGGARFTGTGSPSTGNTQPTVTLNGVDIPPADIISYTSSQIVFRLPAGATTGTIRVRNNDSDLQSAASAGSLTVHPAIDQTLSVTVTPPSPAQNQSVSFAIPGAQSGYGYELFLDAAPVGITLGSKATDSSLPVDNLAGGTLSEAGLYNFRIAVSRAGCTTRDLNAPLDLNVLALIADAGADAVICEGESVRLGGSPPAIGGTGFNSYSWSPATGLDCATCPNPTATPTTTTVYTLTINNNIGATNNDNVTVTVNPTTTADFAVQAYPGQQAIPPGETSFTIYTPADKPIILNGIVAVGDSLDGIFTGPGVGYKFIGTPINENRYVFNPSSLNVGSYDITYTYIDPVTGCESSHTKTLTVYSKSINGLADEYCANDDNTYPLTVEPTLIPPYATANADEFYVRFPATSYRQASNVVNNGGSLTLTVANHGLSAGSTYFIQVVYGFTGGPNLVGSPPYGYISGNYTVSNVTQNTFDIPANVTGNWDGTGSYIELSIYPVSYNLINATTIRVTTNRAHGFVTGARPRHYIEGLSFDGGLTYWGDFYFPVSVVDATQYDILLPPNTFFFNPYVELYNNEYKISGANFTPNIGASLNSNFASATTYEVGYFITENGCTYSYCSYPYTTIPVKINPLPSVDFGTLAANYCFDNNTPVVLTGTPTNLDGTYTASPNVGLVDGGVGSVNATFVPSNVGAVNVGSLITITYSATDSKGCTNFVEKTTTVRALPTVSAGPDLYVCNDNGPTSSVAIGGAPTATGSAPLSYSWSNAASLEGANGALANPVAKPAATTNYTVTVTDGFGCVNTDDTQVTVNSPATVNAGPVEVSICSATPLQLSTLSGANYGGTATEANWGLTNAPVTGNFRAGVDPEYNFDLADTFTPSAADVTNRFVYIVLSTDDPDGTGISGPCPIAKDSVRITINATPGPPTIDNTGTRDETLTGRNVAQVEYHCVTPGTAGAIPSLSATGSAGSTIKWYNNPSYTGGVSVNPFPTGITSANNSLTVFYATQVDVNGCEGTWRSDTLIVNPAPAPNFIARKFCEGDFTEFDAASSSITYTNGRSGQIVSYSWKFDDGDGITGAPLTIIPANENNGGRTSGTFGAPSHRFQAIGSYAVSLTATSNDGCSNTIVASNTTGNTTFGDGSTPPNLSLRIGRIPKANFSYSEICEGDVTEFNYLEAQNPAAGDMKSYEWDFGDPASGPGNTSTDDDPSHTFDSFNTYLTKLKLTSNLDCVDSVTKPVFILPYIQDFTSSYIQSFETANHGWVHEGLALDFRTNTIPDSWNLTNFSIPANKGSVINTAADGNFAFITRPASDTTYRNNERSVLYGPCINVSNLERPALSFSYRNNTQAGGDGVYLEASIDGGNNWEVVGSNTTGLRWYNQSSIGGLTSQANVVDGGTVGQAQNQYGFSGTNAGWTVGKFSLEPVASQTKLRIRFVFGSNGDNPPGQRLNGFALDYFKLDSRERVVLVENFTNNTETANNTAFNNFKSDVTDTEIVKLQYHTSLEGEDPINQENSADPNARVAFYGITTAPNLIPRAFLDGYSQGNFMQAWPTDYYSLRSLEDTPFDIQVSTVSTDPGMIEVTTAVEATLSLPASSRPILRIAIAERTVGPNEYVLRKILPSAAGYPLYDVNNPNVPIIPGPMASIPNFSWRIDNENIDQDNLVVIAFIQDKETNLDGIRQVYQTAIDINPDVTPSVVTGVEDPEYGKRTNVYPNPANHIVNVELPAAAGKPVPVELYDAFGRVVYQSVFKTGERVKTISTAVLPDGIYMLQLDVAPGKVVKKVLVTHR